MKLQQKEGIDRRSGDALSDREYEKDERKNVKKKGKIKKKTKTCLFKQRGRKRENEN